MYNLIAKYLFLPFIKLNDAIEKIYQEYKHNQWKNKFYSQEEIEHRKKLLKRLENIDKNREEEVYNLANTIFKI